VIDPNESHQAVTWQEEQAARARHALALQIVGLISDAVSSWRSVEHCKRFSDHELNITAPVMGWMRKLAGERGVRLNIEPEPPEWTPAILAGEADARGAARMDLRITSYESPYEWRFVIECKRLGGGVGAPEYVKGGVLDFVLGRYCPDHDWSAMQGYIVSSDASLWFEHVNAEIVAHELLGDQHQLYEATDCGGPYAACSASTHPRSCGPTITLRHTWFDLREDFAAYPPTGSSEAVGGDRTLE